MHTQGPLYSLITYSLLAPRVSRLTQCSTHTGESNKVCGVECGSLPTSCPHLGNDLPDACDRVFCILCNSKSWAHNKLSLYLWNKLMNVFYEAREPVPVPFFVNFGGYVAKMSCPRRPRGNLAEPDLWGPAHFSPPREFFSEGFQATTGAKMMWGQDYCWEKSFLSVSNLWALINH